jgi:hypothetical protein
MKQKRSPYTICCIKGCDAEARALGFCNHHYMQWNRYGHPLACELKFVRHGHRSAKSSSPEYMVWSGMIKRCTEPRNAAWPNYGARGITVCERWLKSFNAFLEDMGKRPDGYSLDRIDNAGNYEPSNCRWTTKENQSRDRRTTVLNEDIIKNAMKRIQKGETVTCVAKDYGIKPNTLYAVRDGRSWREIQWH